MKTAFFIITSLILAGCTTMLDAPPAQRIATAPAPAADPMAESLRALREARSPAEAIQAYADAQARTPGDLFVQQAYVQRMVEFGLPEMADVQARDLNRRQPDSGLAWAVSAYMSAKRGQTSEALEEITRAAQLASRNLFVLRTSGQLVAWYDTRADQGQLPAATKASVEWLRRQLADSTAYNDAYAQAAEVYRQTGEATTRPAADLATTAPASTQAAESVAVPPGYVQEIPDYLPAPPPVSYYNDYSNYNYYGYPYYRPDPYYSYGYGYYYDWWPSYSPVVIVGRDHFFRDHFFRSHFDSRFDSRFHHFDREQGRGDFGRRGEPDNGLPRAFLPGRDNVPPSMRQIGPQPPGNSPPPRFVPRNENRSPRAVAPAPALPPARIDLPRPSPPPARSAPPRSEAPRRPAPADNDLPKARIDNPPPAQPPMGPMPDARRK